MVEYIKTDKTKFAVYHTIYTDADIFARFDWNERVDGAVDNLEDTTCVFIYEDEKLAGGFSIEDNHMSYPFIAPGTRKNDCGTEQSEEQKNSKISIDARKIFWDSVLSYAAKNCGKENLFLNEIPEADALALVRSFGAELKWSKRRMLRPTEPCVPTLDNEFYFDALTENDKPEMIDVIFEAHSAGYTKTVFKPDTDEIKNAVERRFRLFGETETLYMGNVVRTKSGGAIAGVCIAGIYPCQSDYSTKNFATIHQLSVKPEYRRRGIATAMIQKSINDAHPVSPVMTLGVLIGNPAEKMYESMGFKTGPVYSGLVVKYIDKIIDK